MSRPLPSPFTNFRAAEMVAIAFNLDSYENCPKDDEWIIYTKIVESAKHEPCRKFLVALGSNESVVQVGWTPVPLCDFCKAHQSINKFCIDCADFFTDRENFKRE